MCSGIEKHESPLPELPGRGLFLWFDSLRPIHEARSSHALGDYGLKGKMGGSLLSLPSLLFNKLRLATAEGPVLRRILGEDDHDIIFRQSGP